jgi:hypothetical protein
VPDDKSRPQSSASVYWSTGANVSPLPFLADEKTTKQLCSRTDHASAVQQMSNSERDHRDEKKMENWRVATLLRSPGPASPSIAFVSR